MDFSSINKPLKRNLLALITCFLLCSCNPSRDWAIQINATYHYKNNGYDCSQGLELDEDKERFVWNYQTENLSEITNFHFQSLFGLTANITYGRKKFRFYDENLEEITFVNIEYEDSEYYEFAGNKIIYIDYSEGNSDLKFVIQDKNFMVIICGIKWFADPNLFD